MIGTLVPTLARFATEATEVDKGEGIHLHLPHDVRLQDGVCLPGQATQLATGALLQFVVEKGFQES